MATPVSHKAISLSRQLKEDLALVLGSTLTESFDSNGCPVLTYGAATANSQSASIRVKMVDSIQTDGLGLTQRVFTPHIIQLLVEESATADVLILKAQEYSKILAQLVKHGTRVEVWHAANTNAPTFANIANSTLEVVIDHIWHPLTSSM